MARGSKGIALSVDWDYFVVTGEGNPNENQFAYDWGHSETFEFMLTDIWPIRAASLIELGLPLPETSGEEGSFWSQFSYSLDCDVVVAESHFAAFKALDGFSEIWNYDAHHDFGYGNFLNPGEMVIDCGSWAFALAARNFSQIHVRYPTWKRWAFNAEPISERNRTYIHALLDREFASAENRPTGPVDRVFLCRSGSWSPSWLDGQFQIFQRQIADRVTNGVVSLPHGPLIHRQFDWQDVESNLDTMRLAKENREMNKKASVRK